MSEATIWVEHGTPAPHWQLDGPVPPGARWTLLGWRTTPPSVDAGLTPPVRAVFARALATATRVTFPCSRQTPSDAPGWRPEGPDRVSTLELPTLAGRAVARLTFAPRRLTLVSTREAATVEGLFDDTGFPWWLQAQTAVLSPPDAPPPVLDFATVNDLLGGRLSGHVEALRRGHVQAVLRPAVDGDACGLLGLDGNLDERVIEALAVETRRAGMAWSGAG